MKILITFTLFVLSFLTYAIMGRSLEKNLIPPQVCKLSIQKKTNETFDCSATIIGANILKTAAHCFFSNAKLINIKCPQEKSNFQVNKILIHSKADKKLFTREVHHRTFDHALIFTNKKFKTPALKTLQQRSEIEDLIRDEGAKCLIAGYGLSDEYIRTGHLKATSINNKFLKISQEMIQLSGSYRYQLMPGDSGGGLLCSKDGKWYDIGTASAHDWDHTSLFAPTDSLPVSIKYEGLSLAKEEHIKPSLFSNQYSIGESYIVKSYSEIFDINKQHFFYNGDLTNYSIEVEKVLGEYIYGTIKVSGTSSKLYLCSHDFYCQSQSIYVKIKKGHLSTALR